jgi:threonine synthase
VITGYRCAVCGASVDVATPFPWRCPNATASDPYHVLHLVDDGTRGAGSVDDPNPFVRYGPASRGGRSPRAHGMSDERVRRAHPLGRRRLRGHAVRPVGLR